MIRVLGCHGSIAARCHTTSFLLDDDILIDAGTGVGELRLDELARIDHVLLSHSHLDHILSGKIRTGTSPTASRSINVYVAAPLSMSSGTPTWPDVLDGTDSAETFTSANVMNGIVKLAASLTVDSTSDRDYSFSGISVASLFGGVLPPEYVVYVAHDTGVNLNSTGSNHEINYFRVQGNV